MDRSGRRQSAEQDAPRLERGLFDRRRAFFSGHGPTVEPSDFPWMERRSSGHRSLDQSLGARFGRGLAGRENLGRTGRLSAKISSEGFWTRERENQGRRKSPSSGPLSAAQSHARTLPALRPL